MPTSLERCQLPSAPDAWADVILALRRFLERHGMAARDLWVIVPFAQHLPLAREAWASQVGAGWMPRFETTQTLAAALGPPQDIPEALPTGNALVDRLAAAPLLASQSWARWTAQNDVVMFRHWVRLLVETTHQLMEGAACQPPDLREAWWARVQERLESRLAAQVAAGEVEGALARVAWAWARQRDTLPTDALFRVRPAAWAVVQAGEVDALMASVVAQFPGPALWLEVNPPEGTAITDMRQVPSLVACRDAEEEAQVAAARVLRHVADGEVPVALVAQDRGLVRRIRALLEREKVRIHDETGWKLSTTRAGACVMGLLRLCEAGASTDELLDWLKSGFVDLQGHEAGLVALEEALRRQQAASVAQVRLQALPEAARSLWQFWSEVREPLARLTQTHLARWQQALVQGLQCCGAWQRLQRDPAGAQLLQALHLYEGEAGAGAYGRQAAQLVCDRVEYRAWVDEVLEAVSFRPAPQEPAEVVIAPLSRCMLRPFAAVVLPGCDHTHLGAAASVGGCLSEAERRDLGLPTGQALWQRERLALRHVLTHPRLSLSWRRTHQGEPLQVSPLLEPLRLALRRAGRDWAAATDGLVRQVLPVRVVRPTRPSAPALLPSKVSASAYEALRACPYRFFALHMLGLQEVEVLDDAPDRRDLGQWLHGVLHAFHVSRASPSNDWQADVDRLLAMGRQQQQALGLDDAAFLAEWLYFERLAPAYVDWLHAQEAQGWRFERGEWAVSMSGAGPADLKGRLDRVDRLMQQHGGARARLIDYKTSSADSLRARVRRPLEDTQLAFYAALWEGLVGAVEELEGLEAGYLALETPVKWIEHPRVTDSAAALRAGLAEDFTRLAAGAPLPPLGQGPACEHCAAAGLCRKAHWDGSMGEEALA